MRVREVLLSDLCAGWRTARVFRGGLKFVLGLCPVTRLKGQDAKAVERVPG